MIARNLLLSKWSVAPLRIVTRMDETGTGPERRYSHRVEPAEGDARMRRYGQRKWGRTGLD
jgi:hypothetical protein